MSSVPAQPRATDADGGPSALREAVPDEEGGVKQFQSWVQPEWWGYKLIKIVAHDFKSDGTDFDVYYSVHVYSHKQQVLFGPPVIKHVALKRAPAS
ncbi:MAG: hypothetical protein B7Z26_06790 [Asticcacaulis sp. 32-58-5]|nr:MAG: hypothetical protein B7Z26_06790 [Asticcacaulis sp. 32-58-5]